jgi:SAM-dependent methyltransferase
VEAEARQLEPGRVLDAERFGEYERLFDRSWMLEQCSARIDRPGLRICDVGGATGVFLGELLDRAAHVFEGTVLEVDPRHETRLARDELRFIQGSILENDLPDGAFDFVTFAHILHHLVGDSARASRTLQERALAEMLRITKPGGYLVFEEQVNCVAPFARAVYELSRLANRTGLRWRFFEAGTVVVRFMTPAEIAAQLEVHVRDGRARIEERAFTPWEMGLRWKITLLMSRVGACRYVLRKP